MNLQNVFNVFIYGVSAGGALWILSWLWWKAVFAFLGAYGLAEEFFAFTLSRYRAKAEKNKIVVPDEVTDGEDDNF